ncbi:hypothetical protein HID58_063704 [Brassica napus]|uniref:Secreted protein n=1 Tax=Brassica napus TaxID=3708 RepID=A0ABQ7XFF5_BRANA|nr:hypothetical protein HID58_063704 [Brassica napus]
MKMKVETALVILSVLISIQLCYGGLVLATGRARASLQATKLISWNLTVPHHATADQRRETNGYACVRQMDFQYIRYRFQLFMLHCLQLLCWTFEEAIFIKETPSRHTNLLRRSYFSSLPCLHVFTTFIEGPAMFLDKALQSLQTENLAGTALPT